MIRGYSVTRLIEVGPMTSRMLLAADLARELGAHPGDVVRVTAGSLTHTAIATTEDELEVAAGFDAIDGDVKLRRVAP